MIKLTIYIIYNKFKGIEYQTLSKLFKIIY